MHLQVWPRMLTLQIALSVFKALVRPHHAALFSTLLLHLPCLSHLPYKHCLSDALLVTNTGFFCMRTDTHLLVCLQICLDSLVPLGLLP